MQLQITMIKDILDKSLQEDLGIKGDVTSDAVIKEDAQIAFKIAAREKITVCGTMIAKYYLDEYSDIEYKIHIKDAQQASAGDTIISGSGNARQIMVLERVILNYLQHLSGIATITAKYVEKARGSRAKIADTRKTTPMMRAMQKYAVTCGGGVNHRLCLDSGIMIKDNHIAICGDIKTAIKLAKEHNSHYTKIEVECDNLNQVEEALSAGADIIMLDNMSNQEMIEAALLIDGRAVIEASGNVSLDNIAEIAKTGVDVISVGKITHSARAVDIGLDI